MSHPSDTELAILKTLWERSPLSARQIHDGPGQALGWSLSSTRTTLSRMVAKGLICKTQADGVRAYRPVHSKARTMASMMRRFFGRVLEIDGPLPTAAFTGGSLLDEAELAEIDRLLADPDLMEIDDADGKTDEDNPNDKPTDAAEKDRS